MNLKLADIRRDDSAQPRAMLNTDHIKDLSDALSDGGDLMPVDVFHDGFSYWLADGFHRYSAYHRAKREEIPVTVHQGQLRDAVLYSITANAKHAALKLTREEKRAGVARLLKDEEWRANGLNWVAKTVGVSWDTVNRIYQELSSQFEKIEKPSERKVKRGDTEYTINTANIGKPKADPPATVAPPVEPSQAEKPPVDLSEYTKPRPTAGYNPARHTNAPKPEDGPGEAEIVPHEPPEDEPYIPPYVSNPARPNFEIKKLSNEPKPKEPPFVEWYVLLGRVQSKGHRSLIEALNSPENQVEEGALEARIKDVIEMLRASLKQAETERTTLTVQS